MSNCAIVGINWGDEGKGRMVDYFAGQYQVVVRYQGGNNAGHTVINEYGKFALNLLPSGIFHPETINLLGAGAVVDLKHLCGEIERLRAAGVKITPDNLKISDRAMMVLPIHPAQDQWEEERLGKNAYGSTRRGISPIYGDKYMKKAIQMGDLLHPERMEMHLQRLIDWKNTVFVAGYGQKPVSYDEVLEWIHTYGDALKPHICDAFALLEEAHAAGKDVMFEAQLGALRDIDYGIYPYTSSSTPLAAYAPIGCGLPSLKVDTVLGIVKAYSTCVGEGPFTAEWFGEEAERLREAGGEYGAATGRPRRVGPFDVVATRYGVRVQGATQIALTKLDVLSYMEKIPVCTQYEIGGKRVDEFPFPAALSEAKPVMEYLPGWGCDISNARKFGDLPAAARDYVRYVEDTLRTPIPYVSVGAARDAIILR